MSSRPSPPPTPNLPYTFGRVDVGSRVPTPLLPPEITVDQRDAYSSSDASEIDSHDYHPNHDHDEELDDDDGEGLETDESPGEPSDSSRFGSDSGLEVDEMGDEYDEEMEASEPLVRRRRRKWDDDASEHSLFELIPPLLLAHPLALFPVLATIPRDFLPAGVALFIPVFCILAALSACAHLVIVYLAWYLKVRTFEDVFAACAGAAGRYGLWLGRAFVLVSTLGLVVGWLGTLFPLLSPLVETYLPAGILESRIFWTILASSTLLPSLIPSRTFRSLRRAPIVMALLLPLVAFLVIGRTVETKKAADEIADVTVNTVKRGLSAGSAGSGLTTLAIFFSPHLNTLPIHSTLSRNKRSSFPIPCLATSLLIVILSLPFALVPYYLLPEAPNVFAQLPVDDEWANLARVLMCVISLGSANMWLLRGRDTVLTALDVDRGERYKAGRWVGLGIWCIVVLFACIGGWLADKIELLGVLATLAVGWLLPSVFFIITFHVRSPLAIIFPSHTSPPPVVEDPLPTPRTLSSRGGNHARTNSLQDPSADALLARKERQLQKRRLERRLWQDLIVYVGILPMGCITMAWSVGSLLGIW